MNPMTTEIMTSDSMLFSLAAVPLVDYLFSIGQLVLQVKG